MRTSRVFSICKRSGAVVQDVHADIPIFYLANSPKSLISYVDNSETIKEVSRTRLKKAWGLEDANGKPLRAARGVVLATPSKAYAEQLAKLCELKVKPSRLG